MVWGNGRVLPYGRTRIIGAGTASPCTSSQATVAFGRIAAYRARRSTRHAGSDRPPCTRRGRRWRNAEGGRRDRLPGLPRRRLHEGARLPRGAPGRHLVVRVDAARGRLRAAAAGRRRRQRPRRRHGRLDAGKHPVCPDPHGGRDPAAAPPGRRDGPWGSTSPPWPCSASTARSSWAGWRRLVPRARAPSAGLAWVAQARDGSPFTATRLGATRPFGDGHYVLGGRGARRVRLAGPGTRRLDRLRERALRGPPGTGQGGGQQPVPESRRRRDASQPGGSTRCCRTWSSSLSGPRLRAHARRRARERLTRPRRPASRGPRGGGGEEVSAPVGTRRPSPAAVVGTLLSDGRALAAWGTVQRGRRLVRAGLAHPLRQ